MKVNAYLGAAVALSVCVERLTEVRAGIVKADPSAAGCQAAEQLANLITAMEACAILCRQSARPAKAGRWDLKKEAA